MRKKEKVETVNSMEILYQFNFLKGAAGIKGDIGPLGPIGVAGKLTISI